METLRIHVECIVRPVRAYGGRKNKMREELLAHLEQRVSAARVRGMTEDDAVALAIENLGDSVQLRAELQATVPPIERLLFTGVPSNACDAWFDKRDGETTLHYARTRAAFTLLLILMALAPIVAVKDGADWLQFLTGERAWDWSSRWAVKNLYAPILIVCGAAAAAFATYLLADWTGIRQRLSKRTATSLFTRILAVEVFFCGHVALLVASAMLALSITVYPASAGLLPPETAAFNLRAVASCLGPTLALLVLAGLPFVAWMINQEHERYDRWGRLKIEE